MASKIPQTGFTDYVGMGVARSYEALARRYGCSKKAIVKRATRERWQERARELEAQAAKNGERRVAATIEDASERHGKLARLLLARGLEGLKAGPTLNAIEALRTIQAAVRMERDIGVSSDVSVEGAGRHGSTRADDGTLAANAYLRFGMQSPRWIASILAAVEHWGDKSDPAERSIAESIRDLCAWIDETVVREDIQPIVAIHVQLRLCFELEEDPSRVIEMEEKLQQLQEALVHYRERNKIDTQDGFDAATLGIDAPQSQWTEPGLRPKLKWAEAFGVQTADDPIAFVANSVRRRREAPPVDGT